jgi:hypothetical protein
MFQLETSLEYWDVYENKRKIMTSYITIKGDKEITDIYIYIYIYRKYTAYGLAIIHHYQ